MRILYVEDNATNVILVQRVANMGKHSVITYDNGEDALVNFEQDAPDCVLLDVQLRGELSGLDVVAKLRERGVKLPVIALTAYAMKGDRQRCLDAGCDDYIPKPISVTELVSVFKRFNDAITSSRSVTLVGGKSPFYKPSTTLEEKKPLAEPPATPITAEKEVQPSAEPAKPLTEVEVTEPAVPPTNVAETKPSRDIQTPPAKVEVSEPTSPASSVAEPLPVENGSAAPSTNLAEAKPIQNELTPPAVVETPTVMEMKVAPTSGDAAAQPPPAPINPPEESSPVSTAANVPASIEP